MAVAVAALMRGSREWSRKCRRRVEYAVGMFGSSCCGCILKCWIVSAWQKHDYESCLEASDSVLGCDSCRTLYEDRGSVRPSDVLS